MAIITRVYSETSGTIAHASSVNKVIDDLYTLQNGNINSANLITSGVDAVNINASAIISTKIGNTAVLAAHINASAVSVSQADESIFLGAQVFG